jgi:alpha-glucosidase
MTETARSSWWRDAVIYQVYPRSFMDSNGDGVGDLRGMADRLDYLGWLGVDAVWINPFYPSPMSDGGYDISDHCDVDPVLGSLDDFDTLLARAHQRGLRVILDYVPNHTSAVHPWFLASRSSRTDPYRDWYYWRDPAPDGGPPNNWVSAFGGPAWTLDGRTGQYYLHSFLPEQPDLNWRTPEVEAAMFDVARFWLDRGVDGFRVDVANLIMKDPRLRDNPIATEFASTAYRPLGECDTLIHLYDKNHPDAHGVYRRFRRLLDGYGDLDGCGERVALGEINVFDWPDWRKEWAAYYGAALDELHLPLDLSLVGLPWDGARVREAVTATAAAVPPGAWPSVVLGNHDEPRVASRWGPDRARAAMILLLTLPGTPLVYYGDELGMTNGAIPASRVQDRWGLQAPELDLGRDPQRTPMQWSPAPRTAGFTAPGVDPWLPVASTTTTVNVAAGQSDPDSMLSFTRRLLQVRRRHEALRSGTFDVVRDCPETHDCLAYVRESGTQSLLVAINFGAAPVPVPDADDSTVLIASAAGAVVRTGRSWRLAPRAAVILIRPAPAGTDEAARS